LYKFNTFMFVQQYVKVLRFARLKIASWVSPMIKSWYFDWCFLLNSFVLLDKLLKYNIFMCGHQYVKDFCDFQDWIAGDDLSIPHFFIFFFISLLTIFQPTPSHISCFTTFRIQWCDCRFLFCFSTQHFLMPLAWLHSSHDVFILFSGWNGSLPLRRFPTLPTSLTILLPL
jgi:hypothetical protein